MRRRETEATFTLTASDPTLGELKQTADALSRASETLRLLVKLDPSLDRFRIDGPWQSRIWDLAGMRLAVKHLAGREAAAKYAPTEQGCSDE